MAANSKSRGIANLGKRVINQIWTTNSAYPIDPFTPSASAPTIRRAAYSSLYEKNSDDQVLPSVVPDDVIQAAHSDKYWAPNPQTGVFGPTTEQATTPTTATSGGERNFHSASAANAGTSSVLEEKAWFRPTSLEDLEKPHHLP